MAKKKKSRIGAASIALAVINLLNAALALALMYSRRKQVITAVNEDGKVKLLQVTQKETKS